MSTSIVLTAENNAAYLASDFLEEHVLVQRLREPGAKDNRTVYAVIHAEPVTIDENFCQIREFRQIGNLHSNYWQAVFFATIFAMVRRNVSDTSVPVYRPQEPPQ